MKQGKTLEKKMTATSKNTKHCFVVAAPLIMLIVSCGVTPTQDFALQNAYAQTFNNSLESHIYETKDGSAYNGIIGERIINLFEAILHYIFSFVK